MADVHDKATRSKNMAAIKGKEYKARNAGAKILYMPVTTGSGYTNFISLNNFIA